MDIIVIILCLLIPFSTAAEIVQEPPPVTNIWNSHGKLIIAGLLLGIVVFVVYFLTFCVDENPSCAPHQVEDTGSATHITLHKHHPKEKSPEESPRTIVIVKSLSQQGGEEDSDDPTFKPRNFSFYSREP